MNNIIKEIDNLFTGNDNKDKEKKSISFIRNKLNSIGFSNSEIDKTFQDIKLNKIKHLTIDDKNIIINFGLKLTEPLTISFVFSKSLYFFCFLSFLWLFMPFIFYLSYGTPFDLVIQVNINDMTENLTTNPIIHDLFSMTCLLLSSVVCLIIFTYSNSPFKQKIIPTMKRITAFMKFKMKEKSIKPNSYAAKTINFIDGILYNMALLFIIILISIPFNLVFLGFYIYVVPLVFSFVFLKNETIYFFKKIFLSMGLLMLLLFSPLLVIFIYDMICGYDRPIENFTKLLPLVFYVILFFIFILICKKDFFEKYVGKYIKMTENEKKLKYIKGSIIFLIIFVLSPIFINGIFLINGFNIHNLIYLNYELTDNIYNFLEFFKMNTKDTFNMTDNLSFIFDNKLNFILSQLFFLKSKIVVCSIFMFLFVLFFNPENKNNILKLSYLSIVLTILMNVLVDVYLYSNIGFEKLSNMHRQTFLQCSFLILLLPIIKDIIKNNNIIDEVRKLLIFSAFIILFFAYLIPYLDGIEWINRENYIALFLFLISCFIFRGSSYSFFALSMSLILLVYEIFLIKDFKGVNFVFIIYTLAVIKDQLEIKFGKKMTKFFI